MMKKLVDAIFMNPLVFELKGIIDDRQKNLGIFKKELNAGKNEKVLDIGCGVGNFSQVTQGQYIGIDLNESFVKFANNKYGNSNKKFIVMDATKMSFQDKSFDKTMFVSMLHHFFDDDGSKVLSEARRVTKKKVLILDIVPTRRPVVNMLYKLDGGHHIRLIEKQIRLIEKHFKIDKVEILNNFLCVHSLIICKPLK